MAEWHFCKATRKNRENVLDVVLQLRLCFLPRVILFEHLKLTYNLHLGIITSILVEILSDSTELFPVENTDNLHKKNYFFDLSYLLSLCIYIHLKFPRYNIFLYTFDVQQHFSSF